MAPTFRQFLVSALSLSSTYQYVNAVPFDGLDTPTDGLTKRAQGWTRMPGEVANCAEYYYTHNNGETCQNIIAAYKKTLTLTEAKLKEYNPHLKKIGCVRLKAKEAYCVKVKGEKVTPPAAAAGPKAQIPVAKSPAKEAAKSPVKGAAKSKNEDDDDEDTEPSASATADADAEESSTAPSASATASGGSNAANASMSLPLDVVAAFNSTVAKTLNSYAIVGASIAKGSGTCVNRMEITEMETQEPDTFNLLILALYDMQQARSTDAWSYYQLSG
ncbi:hypothetical protein ABW21_db0202044 [Orbilia brochopaga]|nr:hypothetical protein ABW21_db0202044 [Drechslerella brochopaga]